MGNWYKKIIRLWPFKIWIVIPNPELKAAYDVIPNANEIFPWMVGILWLDKMAVERNWTIRL